MENYSEKYHRTKSLLEALKVALPAFTTQFFEMREAALESGVLSKKVKHLMALAVSINLNNYESASQHIHDALAENATQEEIMETIGLGVLMGGDAALAAACEAYAALKQIKEDNEDFVDSLYA